MNLELKISKLIKKVNHSYGCDYLFEQFDDLTSDLEGNKEVLQMPSISEKLVNLIDTLTKDSLFNTYSSPNWIRYSVRCFYCADILLQYMDNMPNYQKAEGIVTKCFLELVQHHVAAVLPQDTLDKYIEKCCKSIEPKILYDSIIQGAICGSQRHRLWSADEVTLSCAYTKSLRHIIEKYIIETNDYAALKEWLPLLDTECLTEIVENYPNSANYKHTKPHSREIINDMLIKMLEVHQSLISMCSRHDTHACIDTDQQSKSTHLGPKCMVCIPTWNCNGFVPLEEALLTLIKNDRTFYLHDLIQYNIPLRDAYRDMGAEAFTKDLLALTNGNEDIAIRMQQFNDWIIKIGGLADYDIQVYPTDAPLTFFGVTMFGLEDIKKRVESKLNAKYKNEHPYEVTPALSDIHVGKIWESYPSFDSFDAADDRTYDNYLIRDHVITEEEMFTVKDLQGFDNSNRVTERISDDCLPLVYYEGSGNKILVATPK